MAYSRINKQKKQLWGVRRLGRRTRMKIIKFEEKKIEVDE
jgi:hypothetical protein